MRSLVYEGVYVESQKPNPFCRCTCIFQHGVDHNLSGSLQSTLFPVVLS